MKGLYCLFWRVLYIIHKLVGHLEDGAEAKDIQKESCRGCESPLDIPKLLVGKSHREAETKTMARSEDRGWRVGVGTAETDILALARVLLRAEAETLNC